MKMNVSYRLRGNFIVSGPSWAWENGWKLNGWDGMEWPRRNERNGRKSLQQLGDRSDQPASGLAEWPPW